MTARKCSGSAGTVRVAHLVPAVGASDSPSPVLVLVLLGAPQRLRTDAFACLTPAAAYTMATWATLKRRRLVMMVSMFVGTLSCTAAAHHISALPVQKMGYPDFPC